MYLQKIPFFEKLTVFLVLDFNLLVWGMKTSGRRAECLLQFQHLNFEVEVQGNYQNY